MLVQTVPQELPTAGKITCLAARVHNHVKVEGTPFTGVMDTIMSFIKDGEELSRFLTFLRDTQPDFRPGKKSSSPYLDDAAQASLIEYVSESVYAFRNYNLHGDRAYKRNNAEVFNTLYNDEGDSYSEQDNIMNIQWNNPIERGKWRAKLPALLKRLHDKGKLYGISTISCIRAMAIYKEQGKNVKNMTPGHFISYGIYKMDKTTGECTEKLTINSGLFQSVFQYWLLGKTPDIVYRDLVEFISICSKANIDLTGLDPREYGESYIRTLITSYITPNSELLERETQSKADRSFLAGNPMPAEVLRSISNISLSKYLSGLQSASAPGRRRSEPVSLATEVISMVKSSSLWSGPVMADLPMYLYKITKRLDFINGIFIDGVYCEKDSSLKYIDVGQVVRPSTKTLGSLALLFSAGYFVLVTRNRDGFLYIPFSMFKQYFETKDSPSKDVLTFSSENERKGYGWGEWIAYDF